MGNKISWLERNFIQFNIIEKVKFLQQKRNEFNFRRQNIRRNGYPRF